MTNRFKLIYWSLRKGRFAVAFLECCPISRRGDFLWSVFSHRQVFGRFPALKKPATFNEHLLQLKLSTELGRALRVRISDKEFVKDYVREKLGEGFTPKTIAVLKSASEISNFSFPDNCIIKPTHCSGKNIIRRNGLSGIDRDEIISWLEINYYEAQREINYRPLEPKVIVEELLVEDGVEVPKDYKFFCFKGRAAFIGVGEIRRSIKTINYFSPEWHELTMARKDYLPANKVIPKPPALDRMLHIARQLSAEFSFIRVDFYQIGERILIGELTNLPDAAKLRWASPEIDLCLGRLFETPECAVEALLAARHC